MTPKLNRLYDHLDTLGEVEEFQKFLNIIASFMKARQLRHEADDIEDSLAQDEALVLYYAKVATLNPDEQLMARDHIEGRIRIKKEKKELEEKVAIEKSNREELDRVKAEGQLESQTEDISESKMPDGNFSKQISDIIKTYNYDVPLLEVDH